MQKMVIGKQQVPVLGMGTWHMGVGNSGQYQQELASLEYGLNHGLNVIDTAEMYGEGASERLVGDAISKHERSKIYLISKFYPANAAAPDLRNALANSLQRLGTDYLDLYLLHWRGEVPLSETMSTLQDLQREGLIRDYGVSNFDTADLAEALAVTGGAGIHANEILYNLTARGSEFDLLAANEQAGVATIGYSPFGSGDGKSIVLPASLRELAASKGITEHQLMLAWTIRSGQVLSIPKAGNAKHMAENIAAAAVNFTLDELALIDKYFPAPNKKTPLAVI